jgi:uncharacterized protein YegL
MKDNHSHIVVLLDKSGSMKAVRDDTIGGFNTFLEEQKKVPGTATLTLVQFSDKCHTTYMDVSLAHVAPLTRENYKVSGWTSLNDALAKTIDEVGQKLMATPEKERPSKVTVLVITDGAENTSVEFGGFMGLVKVKEKIKHQTEKYNWSFVFLGANVDAFSTASNYGILPNYTINYTSNSVGSANVFKTASRGLVAERMTGGKMKNGFFENEVNMIQVNDVCLDTADISSTIQKYTGATTAADNIGKTSIITVTTTSATK